MDLLSKSEIFHHQTSGFREFIGSELLSLGSIEGIKAAALSGVKLQCPHPASACGRSPDSRLVFSTESILSHLNPSDNLPLCHESCEIFIKEYDPCHRMPTAFVVSIRFYPTFRMETKAVCTSAWSKAALARIKATVDLAEVPHALLHGLNERSR